MVVFLGSIYPQRLYDELIKRAQFVDYPANVFQHSMLKGLDAQYRGLRVVTSPVIKSKYSEVSDICKKCMFSYDASEHSKDYYVGTTPIAGVQIIVEFWRVWLTLKKLLKKSKEQNILFIYALHSPFLLAAVLLKKRINCSCVVVPDLPEFMTSQGGLLRRLGKKLDRRLINYCLKRLDVYVLLSEHMKEKLPLNGKPWVLMEGIYDSSIIHKNLIRNKNKVVFYGGSLSKRYGIMNLLNAFSEIHDENYRLWICGDGDCKEEVLKMAENDSRIKYWGIVSHNEVLALQQQATVLVNPRSSTGDYTKYSFPSKTMEYLASGTPTIMCHLPAIPEEYDQYLFYISEETPDGIKKKIVEVCEKPQQERDEFGNKASLFIKEKKNSYSQSKKVSDMINRYINERAAL